ncbi:unnamed protein product [Rotaria sp. Silwood1]|nr:unnamed protein product [Rotaria sp. Silwood1]
MFPKSSLSACEILVCWSPDGKYIATGGEDDFITLFSLDPNEHTSRVICRGHGHTSWINAISFDTYMNAKTYYSSFIQPSSSFNNDNENNHGIKKFISYTNGDASYCDTNIPSLFYRIGSVGQDNRLCLWDITEDILKININSKQNSITYPLISTTSSSIITSNGYLSSSSDIIINNQISTTTKSSFSSLTSRLSFVRHSNKINKSIDDTSDITLLTQTNGSLKKSRKLPLFSNTSSGNKSISSKTTTTTTITSDDTNQNLLLNNNNNNLSSRQTSVDLTKSTFGTNLCPKLDDIQVIEPIITEFIAHERLNGIYFGENYLITSSQDGLITIWEKPQKLLNINTVLSSKMTSATGQLIQRIRLYDEEEHPTQNNIMVDEDLVQYYQLLADRGDAQAQYGLGQLYYLRDTAFDKALYYFRLAAESGNSNAMAYLGKLYSEKNDYIKQNNITALQFFQRSAEKGNPIGQAGVGMAFYHGAGIEQNYEKAFKYFQLSADQGYVEGQLMLGIMYYKGEGVKRDYKMAIKWFQAASQSGHALGYYNLGQMHATGTGVLRSCTTATELFKNVAERGKWSNMFIEAYNLYRQGHIEQAFMKYLYLSELGYEVAQSNVAYLLDQMPNQLINIYHNKDEQYRRALIYWNRAATQGFHTARVKLGDYFYYGYGTEQNYETAATHYKYASDQSQNPQAMFNLAYMHEKGLGLKRDIHLAKRFYDMAAETSADAYLPVSIVLFKLNLQLFWEKLTSIFFSSSSTESMTTSSTTSTSTISTTTTSTTSNVNENHSTIIDFDSSWDLYLMAALLGLIGALYTIRRQRAALQQQQQQQPVQAPVQIYLFLFLLSSVLTLNNSFSIISSKITPYCSFFSNRAPSPQPALTNCTWFKEYSCCHDNEVRLIFSQVRPLIGSSSECTRFINVLMCYVCSPLQYIFLS